MNIACYFGGSLLQERGTPLRARNITLALARLTGVSVTVFSPDDSNVVRSQLAVEHVQVSRDPGRATAQLDEHARARRPDLYYGHSHKALGVLGELDRRLAPRVADLHGDTVAELWKQRHRPLVRRAFSVARRWIYLRRYTPQLDAFTSVSQALIDRLDPGPHGNRRPTLVIRGGVEVQRFEGEPRSVDGAIRVAYAGNFRSYQGVRTLVDAMQIVIAKDDRFVLQLAGTHEDDPGLAETARRMLGPKVTIDGPVPYADVPALMARADVLVLPRDDAEESRAGFPSKLAEYMAAGRAVIATDVGEHAQMVAHDLTGLIVPPSDPRALAAALLRLADPAIRDRLALAARHHAEAALAWPMLARRLVEFFEHVIAAR